MLDLDGEALGKPADARDAVRRWQRMRGRSGVLRTGHYLLDLAGGTELVRSVATTVHFADVDDEEVADYVASGEPLQVAGAFTVDGLGGAYVTGIAGDHHNVVGLSLPALREMFAQLGVAWRDVRA
jgi:septum formation protein